MQQPQQRERKIYWGVVNPKGESNSKSTYYFQECQLQQLAKEIIGLPVKIAHNHILKNGKESPAAGRVIHGHVHPKTGQVWAGFIRSDNSTGELAGTLLGEDEILPPELRMGELSLGFDIITDLASGAPKGHIVKELSICYAGARPGCQIKGTLPYSPHGDLSPQVFTAEQASTPPPNPKTYNSKIVSETINKYINSRGRAAQQKKAAEERMEKLEAPPKVAIVGRPDDAQGFDDIMSKLQMPMEAPSGTGIISAKASATYIPEQAAAGDNMNNTMMAVDTNNTPNTAAIDAATNTLERAFMARMASQKRPAEDAGLQQQQQQQNDAAQHKRIRLDFSRYVNGPDDEFKEPVIPAALENNPEAVAAFKEVIAAQRDLWKKNRDMNRQNREKYLARLQGASDNFIPSYIEKAAAENDQVDKTDMEIMMAGMIDTPMADQFVKFIEAQAKQGQANSSLKKDINQLEGEYQKRMIETQELLAKKEQEIIDLKKSQTRPPLAPNQAQQQQQQAVYPTSQRGQPVYNTGNNTPADAMNILKGMRGFERIVAQASLRANQRAPNLEGNKLAWPLIQANAKNMQALWDKYSVVNPNDQQ